MGRALRFLPALTCTIALSPVVLSIMLAYALFATTIRYGIDTWDHLVWIWSDA